jgi:exonuclease III
LNFLRPLSRPWSTGPRLRIVTWNCRLALHKKAAALLALKPDIAVIQECARPERWQHAVGASTALWHGDNPAKGLAVLTFGDWHLEAADRPVADCRLFLPVRVTGPIEFNLLGVWTKEAANSRRNSYIGQMHIALDFYRDFLAQQGSVVAGDLNSNAIWDLKYPNNNHTQAVVRLAELGMVSAYHVWHRRAHGCEVHMTHRHNLGKSFHLDYCFVPRAWAQHIGSVQVGGSKWYKLSDHAPLIVDVSLDVLGGN